MNTSEHHYLSAVETKVNSIRTQFALELDYNGSRPDDFINAARASARGALNGLEVVQKPNEVFGAIAVLAGAREVLRQDPEWYDYDFSQVIKTGTHTRNMLMPNDASALALEQARVEFGLASNWRQIISDRLGRLVIKKS